jgi:hypothetical protein
MMDWPKIFKWVAAIVGWAIALLYFLHSHPFPRWPW